MCTVFCKMIITVNYIKVTIVFIFFDPSVVIAFEIEICNQLITPTAYLLFDYLIP